MRCLSGQASEVNAVVAQGRVVGALGKRAIVITTRRAQLLVPTFGLPLLLLAVISAGTGAATNLADFPQVTSFLAFVLPGTILQGVLIAGITGGIAMATDIEYGFFDRLAAAPVARTSIFLGRLAGTVALVLVQSTFFILVALAVGARFDGGVAGVAMAVVLAAGAGLATGGAGVAIALRTGSISLLQSLFPFMFLLLFCAPAFFPRELLSPALRAVSTYNPLTYIVEGIRAALTGAPGLDAELKGLLAAVVASIVTVALCSVALAGRMRAQ